MTLQDLLGPLFAELDRPLRLEDSPASLWSWDSLRQVDIVLAVEDAFGIALTTTEIAELKSIGALIELLRRRGIEVRL